MDQKDEKSWKKAAGVKVQEWRWMGIEVAKGAAVHDFCLLRLVWAPSRWILQEVLKKNVVQVLVKEPAVTLDCSF
jgi:hypothetical protein